MIEDKLSQSSDTSLESVVQSGPMTKQEENTQLPFLATSVKLAVILERGTAEIPQSMHSIKVVLYFKTFIRSGFNSNVTGTAA